MAAMRQVDAADCAMRKVSVAPAYFGGPLLLERGSRSMQSMVFEAHVFGHARWLLVGRPRNGCRVWPRACRAVQLSLLGAEGGSAPNSSHPPQAGERGKGLLPRGSWTKGNAAYHVLHGLPVAHGRTALSRPGPKSGARRLLMMLLLYAMFVSSSGVRVDARRRAPLILPASRCPCEVVRRAGSKR